MSLFIEALFIMAKYWEKNPNTQFTGQWLSKGKYIHIMEWSAAVKNMENISVKPYEVISSSYY